MTQDKLFDTFEKYLHSNLPLSKSIHPHFEKALGQMLQAGGKRFRPMLLLSVVSAKEILCVQNALPVALALEYLHTYSLIHDDLPAMDDAHLRRGHETLHKSYDEVTAILVGDALNTHAFSLLANAPLHSDIIVKLTQILSSDGGIDGMIIGQAIDCFFENQTLQLEQLEFLHIHKTAKLIAASLKMGAVIANYDTATTQKLYDFGIDIGLLFQIQDDIIDETVSVSEAGKTTANDEGKNSFVNLLGLDGAISSADSFAKKCEANLSEFDESLQLSLKNLLHKYFYRHKK